MSKKNIKNIKNIKNNKKSKKDIRKNKLSGTRKNSMRGGVLHNIHKLEVIAGITLTKKKRNNKIKMMSKDKALTNQKSSKLLGYSTMDNLIKFLNNDKEIKELYISSHKIDMTEDNIIQLAEHLKDDTNLIKLNISNHKFSEEIIEPLADALIMNKTLKILDMTHTGITNDGISFLLETLSGLKEEELKQEIENAKDLDYEVKQGPNANTTLVDIRLAEYERFKWAPKYLNKILLRYIKKNQTKLLDTPINFSNEEKNAENSIYKILDTLKILFPDIEDPNDFINVQEQARLTTILMCINKKKDNNSIKCDPQMQNAILEYTSTYRALIKPEYCPWNTKFEVIVN